MKLSEMTFKQSHDAEMLIAPAIDTIMKDAKTQQLFDEVLSPVAGKKADYSKRIDAARQLTNRLVREHYKSTCEIVAALNSMPVKEVEDLQRAEANKLINEMFTDGDLMGFFASSKRLAQVVQSESSPA